MSETPVVVEKKSWKTVTAGIGMVLAGVSQIALAVVASPMDTHGIGAGAMTVLGGLAVVGLGDKIQKLINAIKAMSQG